MITCNPWNPVATKKVLPYAESEMENSACIYSIAWSNVKYAPKRQVIIRDRLEFFMFFLIISLWVQVTDTPDLTKIIVFNKGTFIGLKELMYLGGQFNPISILGEILEWKYAQKNEKKNKTSEVINRIIPIFNPFEIIEKCEPCFVVSAIIFVHQKKADVVKITVNKIKFIFKLFVNPHKIYDTMFHEIKAFKIGHGLGVIIWNGWKYFVICFLYYIVSFM